MKRTIISALIAILGFCSCSDKEILINYDFSKSEGTTVKDIGTAGADAALMNGARIEGGMLVLTEENAYLDMGEKAGKAIAELQDFTVYARYMIDSDASIRGYGYFLWCFSNLPANAATEGPYHAYRINEQRVETSIGGYTQETGIQKSEVSVLGSWVSVVFRQQSGHGELYINGELVGTEEAFPEFDKIFTEAPACNWIARPPFNGDHYLTKTKVSDFRVYSCAISDKKLEGLIGR